LTVDTNVAINIQNPPRAKAKPMTQRAAARVKPDQKGDKDKNVTNPNWYESPRCNIKPITKFCCDMYDEWTRYWYHSANGTSGCKETFGSFCCHDELHPAFPTYEECLHTCVYHEVPQPNKLDPTPKESCKIELKPNDGCLCQMADQWSRYWYNSTKRDCEVAYGSGCCNMSVYKAFPTYAECKTTCEVLLP